MYLDDNFGEGFIISSHRGPLDIAPIYTQCVLRGIQDVNGVVVISGMELANMIANAFDTGMFVDKPPFGSSLAKSTINSMIANGKSFKDILAEFK